MYTLVNDADGSAVDFTINSNPTLDSYTDPLIVAQPDNQSLSYTFTAVLFEHTLTYTITYDIIWCVFVTEHTQEEALVDL